MLEIRDANLEDIPKLIPLFDQLGYQTTEEKLTIRFKDFISKENYGFVVAEDKDQILGWIAWSMSQLIVLDKIRIHIEGLIVDKKHAGKGIGKQLILFVEKYAIAYSPCIIDLTSGVRRASDGSHEFYKKQGYENDGPMSKLYFRKEI